MKITIKAILLMLLAASAGADDQLKPLKYNNPGLQVDLGVGLWAIPMPMDYDSDGDLDLVVVCTGKPHNGTYFFENAQGKNARMPIFKPGVRIGAGRANTQLSIVDNTPRVLRPGEEYADFIKNRYEKRVKLPVAADIHKTEGRVRDNQWRYVDYDVDGLTDLIVGIGDWTDYGWDDAFDKTGKWTNGPLHGYVYLLRNSTNNDKPKYDKPLKVEADGKPIDVFGMPSPCFADYDNDGDLDLICGEFVDKLTYFENVGTRKNPKYTAGRLLSHEGKTITMEACMINPVQCDWDGDGDIDLIVGQEDGRVAFVENTGKVADGLPQFAEPVFFQQEADELKFGVLVDPIPFDWDNDGDLDLVCGNAAGYIGLIENSGTDRNPKWQRPRELQADGKGIRIQAGQSGSVQGPAEAKWGYTTIAVADWDQDGLPDVIANSILGKVVWFKNIGTRNAPQLATEQPVEVAWPSAAPKPEWIWWEPQGKELITQWRTTPVVIDANGDDLNDLVMLDRDGYLSLFERAKLEGKLILKPPVHAFMVEKGSPSVFDHQQKPVMFDENSDGANDIALADSLGKLGFYTMQPQGDRQNRMDKFANRQGDPAFQSPAGDLLPLRLSGGWAGRSGRRKIALADWDGDGRLDLLVNSQNVTWMKNVSETKGQFVFKDMGLLDTAELAGHDTSPATADFNHDGVPELVVGAEDGFIYWMSNPRSAK
jgi:hypothetical protein